jgi:3-oxoadipate enol-lactonase
MPFANVNNHRIFYEDTAGSGLPIVFSHGFILDHTIWNEQVAALAPDFRCIAYDVRGHGMSDVNGAFTYWDIADDVIGILNELGIEKAVLVGHSQGGWVSMSAALTHASRVAGVVLVGTAADLDAEEVSAAYLQWADAWTTEGPVGELCETMLGVQFGVDAPAHAELWAGKWQSRPPADFALIWKSVMEGRFDLLDRLGEIDCPALVVHGTADVAFDMQRARDTQSGLAQCVGLVEVEGAPHSLSVTHPAQVTDAVRSLAERVAGAGVSETRS